VQARQWVPAVNYGRWLNGKPVREKYFKTNTYNLNAGAAPATVSERGVQFLTSR
jgi:hypothetical protein